MAIQSRLPTVPKIPPILDKLNETKFISTIDLKQSYLQLRAKKKLSRSLPQEEDYYKF